LLLVAAASKTGLLQCLDQALCSALLSPATPSRLNHIRPTNRHSLLNTLLFLPLAGLKRPWDLRSYTGSHLALLSGRPRAYGYHHTERFLAHLAKTNTSLALTKAVANWTTRLWQPSQPQHAQEQATVPAPLTFYVDGHHKPVYSKRLLPRGLVGRLGKILPSRALVLLHDAKGHPLLATTGRGDTHLTVGLRNALTLYEDATELNRVARIVIDREGMASTFLAGLVGQQRNVITLLRTDQYKDLTSFKEVSEFVPLSYNRKGQITREVASAQFELKVTNSPALPLKVALIRDFRNSLTISSTEGEDAPAPARLIPVVTTAVTSTIDPVTLAQTYISRWPRQENIIKDWLLPLGLDTNHGFSKTEVENSETNRRRQKMEQQLGHSRQYEQLARQRYERATKHHHQMHQKAYTYSRDLSKKEDEYYYKLVIEQAYSATAAKEASENEKNLVKGRARLERYRERKWAARERANEESRKAEQYGSKIKQLETELERLDQTERHMAQLDDRKDQLMTILKVALANIGMWVRDNCFGASYAEASWERIKPFLQLGGWVSSDQHKVDIELEKFNDRGLNRDLAKLCQKVNVLQLNLEDGRRLEFRLRQ
jgi:hypothetical protein